MRKLHGSKKGELTEKHSVPLEKLKNRLDGATLDEPLTRALCAEWRRHESGSDNDVAVRRLIENRIFFDVPKDMCRDNYRMFREYVGPVGPETIERWLAADRDGRMLDAFAALSPTEAHPTETFNDPASYLDVCRRWMSKFPWKDANPRYRRSHFLKEAELDALLEDFETRVEHGALSPAEILEGLRLFVSERYLDDAAFERLATIAKKEGTRVFALFAASALHAYSLRSDSHEETIGNVVRRAAFLVEETFPDGPEPSDETTMERILKYAHAVIKNIPRQLVALGTLGYSLRENILSRVIKTGICARDLLVDESFSIRLTRSAIEALAGVAVGKRDFRAACYAMEEDLLESDAAERICRFAARSYVGKRGALDADGVTLVAKAVEKGFPCDARALLHSCDEQTRHGIASLLKSFADASELRIDGAAFPCPEGMTFMDVVLEEMLSEPFPSFHTADSIAKAVGDGAHAEKFRARLKKTAENGSVDDVISLFAFAAKKRFGGVGERVGKYESSLVFGSVMETCLARAENEPDTFDFEHIRKMAEAFGENSKDVGFESVGKRLVDAMFSRSGRAEHAAAIYKISTRLLGSLPLENTRLAEALVSALKDARNDEKDDVSRNALLDVALDVFRRFRDIPADLTDELLEFLAAYPGKPEFYAEVLANIADNARAEDFERLLTKTIANMSPVRDRAASVDAALKFRFRNDERKIAVFDALVDDAKAFLLGRDVAGNLLECCQFMPQDCDKEIRALKKKMFEVSSLKDYVGGMAGGCLARTLSSPFIADGREKWVGGMKSLATRFLRFGTLEEWRECDLYTSFFALAMAERKYVPDAALEQMKRNLDRKRSSVAAGFLESALGMKIGLPNEILDGYSAVFGDSSPMATTISRTHLEQLFAVLGVELENCGGDRKTIESHSRFLHVVLRKIVKELSEDGVGYADEYRAALARAAAVGDGLRDEFPAEEPCL